MTIQDSAGNEMRWPSDFQQGVVSDYLCHTMAWLEEREVHPGPGDAPLGWERLRELRQRRDARAAATGTVS